MSELLPHAADTFLRDVLSPAKTYGLKVAQRETHEDIQKLFQRSDKQNHIIDMALSVEVTFNGNTAA